MAQHTVTIEQLRKEYQERMEKDLEKQREQESRQREWELQNPEEAERRRIEAVKKECKRILKEWNQRGLNFSLSEIGGRSRNLHSCLKAKSQLTNIIVNLLCL